MTLEVLIEWHRQRAGECFAILARVTRMPKAEADALQATAQFHIEAVRLLKSCELSLVRIAAEPKALAASYLPGQAATT
jgi:hypothetical protein